MQRCNCHPEDEQSWIDQDRGIDVKQRHQLSLQLLGPFRAFVEGSPQRLHARAGREARSHTKLTGSSRDGNGPSSLTSPAHAGDTCLPPCPLTAALGVLGGRWNLIVLYWLADGTRRFSDLQRFIPDVTHKMLTSTLRQLESAGLVDRHVYPEVPPRRVLAQRPRAQRPAGYRSRAPVGPPAPPAQGVERRVSASSQCIVATEFALEGGSRRRLSRSHRPMRCEPHSA